MGKSKEKEEEKKEKICVARSRRRAKPCGRPADTTRKIHAAPGIWVHLSLCHEHQHIWDSAKDDWGCDPYIVREPECLCNSCSFCRLKKYA